MHVIHICGVQAWRAADQVLWADKAEEAIRLVSAAKLAAADQVLSAGKAEEADRLVSAAKLPAGDESGRV